MAENEKAKSDAGPGSFAAVLASIRPKTDVELAEKLSKLIEEVKATGKKGTLSIAFEVKPVDGGGQAVIVNDSIRVRAPERTREGSMAFIGEGNRLQRTDPSAMPLFDDDIRDAPANVDPNTGEIKEAPRG
ncbi:hypothetical protein MN032_10890 [Agromyces atrinae]|uniref:hypothetical protein n=1 Tax=Agromyces atrinae TaxID=592376 RepID=UPI001F562171|nr:hypothetical protein [Agromyces atrinae]MCI2958203.1 hypothetical protein [Agromyces atrinae]